MWKWLLGVTVVVLLSCVGGGAVLDSMGVVADLRTRFDPSAKPLEVRFGVVERGDVVRVVSAPGQVEPKTKVEISAQVSARIVALPFREGAQVKSGDVVCRLDARDLAATVASAEAQLRSEESRLESAKATLANATVEVRRARSLHESGDIARSELDAAELTYARAQAELGVALQAIEIARANIDRARQDLSNTVITAPFDGIITRLDAEIGELVVVGTLNTPGSVFLEIADLSTMLVKARVDEANIARVANGQRARAEIGAYDGVVFTGVVQHVGLMRKRDTDGTAYFEADILLDPKEDIALRSGLTASVDIEVEVLRDVLKVPSQAVVERRVDELPGDAATAAVVDKTRGFTRVVFIERNGTSHPVPVRTGAVDLTHTVILDGIDAGTRIVVGPFKALMDLQPGRLLADQATVGAAGAGGSADTAGAESSSEPPPGPDGTTPGEDL